MTTTAPLPDFDWIASDVRYEDLVAWEADFSTTPDGAFESLASCGGAHLGLSAMVQALVSQVEPLGELTIDAVEGAVSVADAAAAWTEWSDAATMVKGTADGLLLAFSDHTARPLIEDLDEPFQTAIFSAVLIASGFDPNTGDINESTLDIWFPTFLDGAGSLNSNALYIHIPQSVDSQCS